MKLHLKITVGAAFVVSALGIVSFPATAAVTIDVTQVGANVVFDATGSLNLTGATPEGPNGGYGQGFISGGNNWYVAPGPGGPVDDYALTSFAGAFGTNATFITPPDASSGDNFFIWGDSGVIAQVGVTSGYISGSPISSGMEFDGATIAGFGMTPGTYEYTLPNDVITLNIGAVSNVPEPASCAVLFAGLGLLSAVRRRKAV